MPRRGHARLPGMAGNRSAGQQRGVVRSDQAERDGEQGVRADGNHLQGQRVCIFVYI